MRRIISRHPRATWGILGVFLLGAVLLGTAGGAVPIPLERILAVLGQELGVADSVGDLSPQEVAIVMEVRLPRVITAAVVGAGLALAGAIFQGLLRNPLADPYVIGTAAGAALGATLAILASTGLATFGFLPVPAAAFLGALLAVSIVYRISLVGSRTPIITLLLAGFAVSSVLTAVMAFLWLLNDVTLKRTIYWTMGGFSGSGWSKLAVVVPLLLGAGLVSRVFTADLNALLLGEEAAAHLGVEVERRKLLLLALGSLLTAAAVSISGLIGFVGLIIPHSARLLFGPEHRPLLPASALIGAIFLVLADLFSRTLLAPQEIPVGIITALIGAPFFIYLLRSYKREYSF
ncbi:MAG: iron ABC transporter permease [Chloroflexi bacterium]|nr:iron ABC transporter permease [Chloroflexota bacterium]